MFCFGILPFSLFAITGFGAGIVFQIVWQVAYLFGFELASDSVLGIALIEVALVPMTFLTVFWL